MVAAKQKKPALLNKIEQIYNRLDKQISSNKDLHCGCKACGRCCNFELFDHKLFVTTLELMYLAEKLQTEKLKPASDGICPYNNNEKCTIYENRFAGCRIFFCEGDKDFQSRLSETVSKEIKSLCNEFKIPYQYRELSAALSRFSNICPPAGKPDWVSTED